MKVLNLSTFDICGGAAIASYRLHQGLNDIGIDSKMLVSKKFTDDPNIIEIKRNLFFRLKNKIISKLRTNKKSKFSDNSKSNKRILKKIKEINPDIVHLHWICGNFLSIEDIAKIKKPIVWTLHDMWQFTGGCHYSGDCIRYKTECSNCPQLSSNKKKDLAYWVFKKKSKLWKNLDITIVTPSRWLAECVKSSNLFKGFSIKIIPYGLNTKKYKPVNKNIAKQELNLPLNKQLILFGAINSIKDQRKGFHLLKSALKKFNNSIWKDKIELVVFGSSKTKTNQNFKFKTHYLGHINDEDKLSKIYSAADVMILPSMQDNLPNTAIESISCGTPCLAFKIGGMSDIINHKKNGYLVNSYEVNDLARGIEWIFGHEKRYRKLSKCAREKALKEFRLELQAKRYTRLYERILKK